MIIWHGSPVIVEHPSLDRCRPANDFGVGFYCTSNCNLAKEWATTHKTSGFANKYELLDEGLSLIDLTSSDYSVLNWIAVLVANRSLNASTPVAMRGIEYLIEHFLVDLTPYDLVVGYRADDSYFSFARQFVNNGISVGQLSAAMRLGELGKQIVLRSQRALDNLTYVESEPAPLEVYGALRSKRDKAARAEFRRMASDLDLDGLYLQDIMREGIKNGDKRLCV